MAERAKRICSKCGRIRDGNRHSCIPELRGNSTQRGYDYDWQQFRALALSINPLCADCLAVDKSTLATQVHHKIKVKDDYSLRLVLSNVICLCASCHSKRTNNNE